MIRMASSNRVPFSKYVLKFRMTVNGFVERNDIIGAIFGQLEGILPPDLDPQNLLNMGRIGRIEVSIIHREGKTYAEITIPCSLNKVEAATLAAAIETVDKIGPAQAETKLESIENVLEERRRSIIERASEILASWHTFEKTKIPPEKVPRLVEEHLKKSKIISYGPEKLPAGVGILKSDEIIIVEGRADVLNLLKHGFDNAIAVGGSGEIPESIIDLSKKKTTTVFVDGDRAGILLLKSLLQTADVDYVAIAPRGKEVEELSFKEIKKALDYKLPTEKLALDISRLEYLLEQHFEEAYKAERVENLEEVLDAKLEKIVGSKRFVALDENLEEIFSGALTLLESSVEMISSSDFKIHVIIMDMHPTEDLLIKLGSAGVKYLAYKEDNKTKIINLGERQQQSAQQVE